MAELDTVRDLAKQTLAIHTATGEPDNCLWERSQRLVRNSKHICQLPELGKITLQTDHFCLITAAYFSDAGLAYYLKRENKASVPVISNSNNGDLLDFCTQIIEEELNSVINKARIEKINRIITESSKHFTEMHEAMILSDARNLDDMGAVGIFNEFKRYIIGGKGVCNALKSWERKIDYQYWQARLKESFHFEQVRKLAKKRLSAAEQFMNQLKIETEAHDLEKICP